MSSTQHDRFSVPTQPWALRYAQRRFVRWAVEAAVPAAVCRTATALLTELLAQPSRDLDAVVVDVCCADHVLRIGVFGQEVESPPVEDGPRPRSSLPGLHLPGLNEALGCGFGVRRLSDGTVLTLEFPRSPIPPGRAAPDEDPDGASAASPAGGVDPLPAGRSWVALRRRTHRHRAAAALQRRLVLVNASGSWASLRAGSPGGGESSPP